MNVAVSVGGRFHAFYLARELLERGFLSELITSYPAFVAARYGIPRDKVRSLIAKEILMRAWEKLPAPLQELGNPEYALAELFDKSAAAKLSPCDICVAWSSFGLRTLRRAHALGARTVLDHGSAHLGCADRILREEYARFSVRVRPFGLPHPKIIEKEKREYEEADYLSIPSSFSKRTFLEAGVPAKKLLLVPYGVDLAEFRPGEKRDSVFRVVFTGGMTLQKGVHYLLQAFAELKLPNAELLLIGSRAPEIDPFFREYRGRFRYLGHVPQKELASHYVSSSVFVLNSIHDGFGMVMVQAMACGLPVIGTANTGAPDLVREGVDGFVIPIRDVEALKERLSYLFHHPEECRKMGETAKRRVSSGFTWHDYGERVTEAYKKILNA